jgi:acetyl/propionyl-CoA carboxylase alpha subunit
MGTMSTSVTRGAAPGELLVRVGDRIEKVYATVAGGVTWVFHDGTVYRLEPAEARRGEQHAHGSLSSPMPATVIGVSVAPGQDVTSGQTLIVLEAMKMELPIRAPGDGRVRAVHCQPGDLVQPDVSLIDFE